MKHVLDNSPQQYVHAPEDDDPVDGSRQRHTDAAAQQITNLLRQSFIKQEVYRQKKQELLLVSAPTTQLFNQNFTEQKSISLIQS